MTQLPGAVPTLPLAPTWTSARRYPGRLAETALPAAAGKDRAGAADWPASGGAGAQAISKNHDIGTARLGLEAPLHAMIAELEKNSGKILTCGYIIRHDSTRRAGRAWVIMVPAEKSRTIAGYILS